MEEPIRQQLITELKDIYFDKDCVLTPSNTTCSFQISLCVEADYSDYGFIDEGKRSFIEVVQRTHSLRVRLYENSMDATGDFTAQKHESLYYNDYDTTKDLAYKLNKVIMDMFGVREF